MIDVIVPVYTGEEHVRRCIESVLGGVVAAPFELIVVDDCSPEPALSAWLREMSVAGRITLLVNETNRGFVGSVNRAIAVHPDRDVVLLNSDTEVSGDWLDRLLRCLRSAPDIGTVTPLSNNATICSYPFDGWGGGVPGTLGLEGLDALIAHVLDGVVVDLPTAVGFCMLVRRAVFDAVGVFDEEAFGRGYGEENDLSLRAGEAGWRNVLCADVYVYHCGGVSFGDERAERMRHAEQVLRARHPEYFDRVQAFIDADPLRPLFERVDWMRRLKDPAEARCVLAERGEEALRKGVRHTGGGTGRPVLLHVVHGWGGGILRWVHDFVHADHAHWNLLLRSRPGRNQVGIGIELIDPMSGEDPLLAWDLSEPIPATAVSHEQYRSILGRIVDTFSVEAIVVSSLVGHSLDAVNTELPTVVILHDLYPYCPALFGWFDASCTRCDEPDLKRCFATNPHNVFWHHDDTAQWRALRDAYARSLESERVVVVVPDRTAHRRLATLLPVLERKPWTLIPHGLGTLDRLRTIADVSGGRVEPHARLRILVPGRLLPHKGLFLLEAMIDRLLEFADVMLLGCGPSGKIFETLEGVRVVPDYANESMVVHVRDFAPHCALLLSILPETYSYTLSEMSALAVPAVATALGAFAERIDDGISGFLVAPEADAIVRRLRALDADREALRRVAEHLRRMPHRSAADMVADYRRLPGMDVFSRVRAPLLADLVEALASERGRRDWLEGRWRRFENSEGELRLRMGEIDNRLNKVFADLDAAKAELADRSARLWDAEHALQAVLASRSWRITRPIRMLSGTLRGDPAVLDQRDPNNPGKAGGGEDPLAGQGLEAARPASAQRRVLVAWGDPLACRWAKMMADAHGLKFDIESPSNGVFDALSDGGGRPLPPGFLASLLPAEVGRGDDGRGSGCVAWFEGAGDPAQHDAVWESVPEGTHVLVPDRDAADALARVCPWLAGEARVVEFPLAGCWPHTDSRAACRAAKRASLGLPDRARLVIGIGTTTPGHGLTDFARIAMAVGDCRNDVRFVWVSAARDPWLDACWREVGAAVAAGKLILVEGEPFEPWLMAADAYLGVRAAGVCDMAVAEGLAAAVPVLIAGAGSLPAFLRSAPFDQEITDVTGRNPVQHLVALVDERMAQSDARRAALAELIIGRFGTRAARESLAFESGLTVGGGTPDGDSGQNAPGTDSPHLTR